MFLLDDPLTYAYPLDLAVNLLEIAPPTTIVGIKARVISPILQENNIEMITPMIRVNRDSSNIAIVSVDNPFNKVISSDKTLLRTPGALSLLSNHATSL
jgi:hypothetical protein